MNLQNFIQQIPNVIPNSICDYFIDFFENNIEVAQRFEGNNIRWQPTFNQIVYTDFFYGTPEWENNEYLNNDVARTINQHAYEYVNELGLGSTFPPNPINEKLRIKKYLLNGSDEFPLHIDAYSEEAGTRFLSMFVYLNDVEEGGHTTFPHLDISIKPEKGKLVMFPSNWMFPHIGEKPISGEKYLLSTYFHYSPFSEY